MYDFERELQNKLLNIEKIIQQYEPSQKDPSLLIEAVNYSLNAGGKRIRPLLLLETFRLFSTDEVIVYPFMAAMEMIHTYSLVHDDLPAMDNDLYRRGKKTTHAAFGENIGILAGDALLNCAFEIMSEAVVQSKTPGKMARAMSLIARKAGVLGMIGGQGMDVLNEQNSEITLQTILRIHKLKTAALMEASMMAGAVLASASDEDIKSIEKMAESIGIAFQIRDDILDIEGDEALLGKPVFSDAKNNKKTYVTFVGLEQSKQQVCEYLRKALDIMEELCKKNGSDSIFLKEFIIRLIDRNK